MAFLRRGLDALWARVRVRRPEDVLFLAAYYRLAYPDVAMVRNAQHHFERYGKLEGRSPHPFIDVGRLARQMPDLRVPEVLDTYLSDRNRWHLSPSPYLDVAVFMDAGPWNGREHPMLQILRERPVEPWLRARLGAIDLITADDPTRIAAGLIAVRHPGLIRMSRLESWSAPSSPVGSELGPGRYRVAPGFSVIGEEREIVALGREVISADGTLVRTPERIIGMSVRDRFDADTLHVLRAGSSLDRDLRDGDLVAPATVAQSEAAQSRGVTALQIGRQVVVTAKRVVLR